MFNLNEFIKRIIVICRGLNKLTYKNGKWTLKKSGFVEINYKYKKEIITVTGNVVNKIFKVGNAWVKR